MAIKKYDKLGKHAIYWVISSIENCYRATITSYYHIVIVWSKNRNFMLSYPYLPSSEARDIIIVFLK